MSAQNLSFLLSAPSAFDFGFELEKTNCGNYLMVCRQTTGCALQQGLRKGDILITINGNLLAGFSVEQAWKHIYETPCQVNLSVNRRIEKNESKTSNS